MGVGKVLRQHLEISSTSNIGKLVREKVVVRPYIYPIQVIQALLKCVQRRDISLGSCPLEYTCIVYIYITPR